MLPADALGAVVNLTDPAIQTALETDTGDLAAPWRPLNALGRLAPTQDLGAAIRATGRIEDDSGLIDARLP